MSYGVVIIDPLDGVIYAWGRDVRQALDGLAGRYEAAGQNDAAEYIRHLPGEHSPGDYIVVECCDRDSDNPDFRQPPGWRILGATRALLEEIMRVGGDTDWGLADAQKEIAGTMEEANYWWLNQHGETP